MEDSVSSNFFLSTIQEHNYTLAIVRFFSYQNMDGSWGQYNQDKVTLTAQAIQLMYALDIGFDHIAFKKAIRWIEDHIKIGDLHWATRLEIGLKVGDFEKMASDNYINKFLEDLEYDLDHPNEENRLDFFWHVIPTLIAFRPYEEQYEKRTKKTPPHEKVINEAMKYWNDFGNECMTVRYQVNQTGLIALYLFTISDKDDFSYCAKLSRKMTNWLLQNKSETDQGTHWEHSRGITSYILIDLLNCFSDISIIEKHISGILKYLTPKDNGYVERDTVTTFSTKLHGESIYVMMLVLRGITEVFKKTSVSRLKSILLTVRSEFWVKKFYFKMLRLIKNNKKSMPIIISTILCVIGIIVTLGSDLTIGLFFLSIGSASGIGIIFDWLKA